MTCDTNEGIRLLDTERADRISVLGKALGDPIRVQLIHYIGAAPEGTACSCELPSALGITQPTMSHHLAKLVEAGILTRERRGRWAHYRLVEGCLRDDLDALLGMGC